MSKRPHYKRLGKRVRPRDHYNYTPRYDDYESDRPVQRLIAVPIVAGVRYCGNRCPGQRNRLIGGGCSVFHRWCRAVIVGHIDTDFGPRYGQTHVPLYAALRCKKCLEAERLMSGQGTGGGKT